MVYFDCINVEYMMACAAKDALGEYVNIFPDKMRFCAGYNYGLCAADATFVINPSNSTASRINLSI